MLPAPLALLAIAGFLAAITGTYWDDAWHTETGRDSFLIPPHVALYAGIGLSGAALVAWAIVARERGAALRLGLLGVGVTLASGPVDNAWHEAFGRDAVVWSPPHMLGVAGTIAIAAALLLELGRRGGRLAPVAGAAVIAAATVPVLEYETDVPQFDEVWYLPVLATGAVLAFTLVARSSRGRATPAVAAAVHAGVIAAVALGLSLGDMPGPAIPLLVIPALAFGFAPRARSNAAVVALFAVYVPYLDWLRSDVHLDAADVAAGLPLALAGAWLAERTIESGASRRARVLAAVALALVLPAVAIAHDPGQGDGRGTARITVIAQAGSARVQVGAGRECDGLRPLRVVARRAGRTERGPLAGAGACRFTGAVDLPRRGRWFVYAEFERGAERLEAWVPLVLDESGSGGRREARRLYVPARAATSTVQAGLGALLYGAVALLLVAIGRLYRAAT